MKKLIYILIFAMAFLLGTCHYVYAQNDILIPRDVAEKALKALELVPKLENQIVELNKLVKDLESSKQTVCSVSIQSATNDLILWHQKFESATSETRKEVGKTLKQRRKLAERSIKAQCNIPNNKSLFEYVLQYAPIAVAIFLKR